MIPLIKHLSSTSLPIKVFIGAAVTGVIIMALIIDFQSGAIRHAFETQLTDLMDEKAFQHRVRFCRSVESYYHVAKMLSAQDSLIQRLKERRDKAAPDEPIVVKSSSAAEWLPTFTFVRSFVALRYALVFDPSGKALELYQNWPNPPPVELLKLPVETLVRATGQPHIIMIAGTPFLLAAEEIRDQAGRPLGLLLLSSPIDEAFLITSNGPATDWNLIALIDVVDHKIISSNSLQRIARSTQLKNLNEHYLFNEPKFLAVGGMELNFRFVSLVNKDSANKIAGNIMTTAWVSQIIEGCAYMGPFIIIIIWLTRRIMRLTSRVEAFSMVDLGYKLSRAGNLTGDQLDVLEQQFQFLIDGIKMRTTQLEAANLELEAFAYSVSHDLRTPLRSIDGFSKALDEDYRERLDEAGLDYLRRVRMAAQRMGTLIDEMLMLSRVSRGEMKMHTVNLSNIAEVLAQELVQVPPERQVELIVAKDVYVTGDEGLLRVVMANLFDNAWKFTSKNRESRIEFGVVNNKIYKNLEQSSRPVYFVADNGVGFDMQFADKLFGAFQRLHRDDEFPGTGVGLATVRRIINRHNGEIWAESELGKGSTFYFSL